MFHFFFEVVVWVFAGFYSAGKSLRNGRKQRLPPKKQTKNRHPNNQQPPKRPWRERTSSSRVSGPSCARRSGVTSGQSWAKTSMPPSDGAKEFADRLLLGKMKSKGYL